MTLEQRSTLYNMGRDAAYEGSDGIPPNLRQDAGEWKTCSETEANHSAREVWLQGYHAGSARFAACKGQIIACESTLQDIRAFAGPRFDRKKIVLQCDLLVERVRHLQDLARNA
jgi:hypothetical protein